MATKYLEKLSDLIKELKLDDEIPLPMEIKHFFSGAALYVNKTICASWSPAGLAFKLGIEESNKLIARGKAKPLQYFSAGHIKKDYALFENPDDREPQVWKKYIIKAAQKT